MKCIALSLILTVATSSAFAATFVERVAIAKDIETSTAASHYFKMTMFPAILSSLKKAMEACTSLPNANLDKFSVVADVTQEGKFINIDHEPKTNTGACFTEAMAAFSTPPPPTCEDGDLPIVIDMSVTP